MFHISPYQLFYCFILSGYLIFAQLNDKINLCYALDRCITKKNFNFFFSITYSQYTKINLFTIFYLTSGIIILLKIFQEYVHSLKYFFKKWRIMLLIRVVKTRVFSKFLFSNRNLRYLKNDWSRPILKNQKLCYFYHLNQN